MRNWIRIVVMCVAAMCVAGCMEADSPQSGSSGRVSTEGCAHLEDYVPVWLACMDLIYVTKI